MQISSRPSLHVEVLYPAKPRDLAVLHLVGIFFFSGMLAIWNVRDALLQTIWTKPLSYKECPLSKKCRAYFCLFVISNTSDARKF